MSKYRNSVHIAISGHKYEDREYLVDRVRPMFAGLFGILLNVRYVKNENSMMLYASNTAIAMTLNEWGMPYGRKKLSRLVPTVRLDETCFVRGIFDTDGCLSQIRGVHASSVQECIPKFDGILERVSAKAWISSNSHHPR